MTEKTKMFVSGAAVGGLLVGLIVAGAFLYIGSKDDDGKEQETDTTAPDDAGDEKPVKQKKQAAHKAGEVGQKDHYVPETISKCGPGVTTRADDTFPLRLGSRGPKVERVQVWLLRNFGLGGQVTGVFDEKTRDRVVRALHTDEVDSKTFSALGMNKPVHQQPSFH